MILKKSQKNISTINEVDETNKIETIEKKLQLDMKKSIIDVKKSYDRS